jgi:hypothetical protein
MTAALVERAPRTRAERTVVTRDGVHQPAQPLTVIQKAQARP